MVWSYICKDLRIQHGQEALTSQNISSKQWLCLPEVYEITTSVDLCQRLIKYLQKSTINSLKTARYSIVNNNFNKDTI